MNGGECQLGIPNIYLDPLDKELEKLGVSFVLDADDIAILAGSQRSAVRIYERIVDRIEKYLKLEVHREKSGVGPSGTSSLLGFRIQENGNVGASPVAMRRKAESDEPAVTRPVATIHPGMVELLPAGRLAAEVTSLSGWRSGDTCANTSGSGGRPRKVVSTQNPQLEKERGKRKSCQVAAEDVV